MALSRQKSFLKKIETIYKDLELIYKQALDDQDLSTALKAKECQVKILLKFPKNNPQTHLKEFNDEDLLTLFKHIEKITPQ